MAATNVESVLYTAKTRTTGGRDGSSRSSDGNLAVKLTPPGRGSGTNPEQLLAAGWSGCYLSAMGVAAKRANVRLPAEAAVDAEVDLGQKDGEYFLQARLNVSLPGVERAAAQSIVETAAEICPYSKAVQGNIEVTYTLV